MLQALVLFLLLQLVLWLPLVLASGSAPLEQLRPSRCEPPATMRGDHQAAAFALASRGRLRDAAPCFAAALQRGAQYPWLWTDYARAVQGAVRREQRSAAARVDCSLAVASLSKWAAELDEATAATHVSLILSSDSNEIAAARKTGERLLAGIGRHNELVQRCGSVGHTTHLLPLVGSNNAAWLANKGLPKTLDDAVAMARAVCRQSADITVTVAGWATAVFVRDALLALRICGVVKLQHVWPPSDLDGIAAAQKREFEHFVTEAGGRDAADSAKRTTTKGTQRWKGRWESTIPLRPPFDDPTLTMQPSLLGVIQAALGSGRLELDTFTQITSVGGADDQPWHADAGPLWPHTPRGESQLPPHGFVVVVPLANVTSERGPTNFQPASHFLPPGEKGGSFWRDRDGLDASPTGVISPESVVGDAVVFDLRLRHRGGRNRSPDPRPLLYISYVHEWFTDSLNFSPEHSRNFDGLSVAAKKLYSRLDHREHVLSLGDAARAMGLDVAESKYAFAQDALSL